MAQVSGKRRSGTSKTPARKVSLGLGIGILFLPIVFVWQLFRAGYSTRSRIFGCIWLALGGTAMLACGLLPASTLSNLAALATNRLSPSALTATAVARRTAPAAPAAAASAPADPDALEDPPSGLRKAQASDAPVEAALALVSPDAGQPPLAFTLGKTAAIYRMLRTPVTLTNNTGADLAYAELDCAFYDASSQLLGSGMGNWVGVKTGATVSGEVVAAGIDLSKVARRDCTAHGPLPTRPAATPVKPD